MAFAVSQQEEVECDDEFGKRQLGCGLEHRLERCGNR